MTLLLVDYFANGKNLFPTAGATAKHLAQLIAELQAACSQSGFGATVIPVGTDGKFTSIQDALASIEDADVSKPYIILLGSKTYTEEVTLKPYTHIVGQGLGLTTISGRIVGPSSGVASIQGFDLIGSTFVPMLDLAGGTLTGDRISISQAGSSKSFRVTGGSLKFESLEIKNGEFQVTGGEAEVRKLVVTGIASSTIEGGTLRVQHWSGSEAIAGAIVNVIFGTLQVDHAQVSNTLGDYFLISGGTFSYGTILAGTFGTGLVLRATAGEITAGLRNFPVGVKAKAEVTVLDNLFDSGDTVNVNGVGFRPNIEFTVGANPIETALNLCTAINDSIDPAIAGVLTAAIASGLPEKVILTSKRAGSSGNALTLTVTDGAGADFLVTGFAGGYGMSQVEGAAVTTLQLGL